MPRSGAIVQDWAKTEPSLASRNLRLALLYGAERPPTGVALERRLAAILAADAVGYSRMMSEDEPGALALLQKHRSEVIDPAIEKHRGRIVKLMGDGLLAEFSSVVEAVTCAAEIQRALGARNAGANVARQMAFRIGVHLGDVIVDGDDLY